MGFFGRGLKKDLKATFFLFLALVVASFATSIFFTAAGINDIGNVISTISAMSVFLLVYMVIIRSAAEEVFFRGFLVKRIGIIPSTVFFAAMHVGYGSIAEIVGAFVLGLILSYAISKNGTVLPNIVAHIFYNLFAVFALMGI